MDEIVAWVARLQDLVRSTPPSFVERYRRVATPTAVSFDDRIVRVVGTGEQVVPFGSLPGELCVLAWPEPADRHETSDDQRLASQLGAILSLASNRRIHVASSEFLVSVEGTTKKICVPTNVDDRSLWGPVPADIDQRFEQQLCAVVGLDAGDRRVIGSAMELHYAAILLVDTEPEAAYALVVAALECLSTAYGNRVAEWSSWEDATRIDGVFDDLNLDPAHRERLRSELLKNRHLLLRQTFAAFAADSLTPDFWELTIEDYVPDIAVDAHGDSQLSGLKADQQRHVSRFIPQNASQFRRRMLATYDRRSTFIHTGSRQGGVADLLPYVGGAGSRTDSIAFAGLRALLRWLILNELRRRSHPAALPGIRLLSAEPGA